ncbi:MAG: hypothetical protein HQK99_01890 [Nitrospirae bacterium]|nr:hypothetical protein [Nitrospirota bacterium]
MISRSLRERIKRLLSFPAMYIVLIAALVLTSIAAEAASYNYYTDICGHQWTQLVNSGKKYWWGLASSTDGERLAAIEYQGYIYTSNDNGTTWTRQTTPGQRGWVSITLSHDGKKIAAVENDNLTDGGVWQGTDNGTVWSWTSTHVTVNNYYMAIASSADGTLLYAGDYSGHVYKSSNNWSSTNAGEHIYSIATSADGSDVYAGTVNGWLHYSTDNGTTYISANGASATTPSYGSRYWWSITTGTTGGTSDVFAVDGSGGNVIFFTTGALAPTIDSNLTGKNLTSISYDNYIDDTATAKDFIAVTDFGASGGGGYLYTTSVTSGSYTAGNWTTEDTDNSTGTSSTTTPRMWSSVVVTNGSGTNGLQITAAEYGGYIWRRTEKHPQYKVAVNKGTGTGNGTVYATSSNITWYGDNGTTDNYFTCPDYATLTAEPTDLSSAFDGWVGCDTTSGAKCTVRLTSAKSVQAVFGFSATDHKMTVSTSGGGTITSSPTGINCGTNGTSCSSTFPDNYTVTLTATADSSYAFKSWTGCDWSTGSLCAVTLASNRSVSATFQSGASTLTVTKSGTGTGTVSSSPTGISCGTTCSYTYTTGTSVILTATPDTGNSFTGWTGCDSTSTTHCTVSVSSNKTVSAIFSTGSTSPYILTVTKSGSGTGTVTSSPTGISCGTTCNNTYLSGTFVTLTAAPDTGSSFTGWSGCDTTSGTQCTALMSLNRTVSATFTSQSASSYTLAVNKTGNGTATITSSPSGINCGATCYKSFTTSSSVTLTATTDNSTSLLSWTGCDSSSYNQCTVSLTSNSNRYVYAALSFQPTNLDNATAWITTVYNQYASWFGTRSGSMVTGTTSSGTYYVQWFTNGSALVAWTDGSMFTYYNGNWYALGTNWQTSNNLYMTATAWINAIYNEYAWFFGTQSGTMSPLSAATGTYYKQSFSNGATLVAWTDGNMYTLNNGVWYDLGVSWTNIVDDATAWINTIKNQDASWIGTPSGGILTETASSGTYYQQLYTNGNAIAAWTDGYLYVYYNGAWYSLGIGWR